MFKYRYIHVLKLAATSSVVFSLFFPFFILFLFPSRRFFFLLCSACMHGAVNNTRSKQEREKTVLNINIITPHNNEYVLLRVLGSRLLLNSGLVSLTGKALSRYMYTYVHNSIHTSIAQRSAAQLWV